jgi:hypothetical protein
MPMQQKIEGMVLASISHFQVCLFFTIIMIPALHYGTA